MENTLIPAAQYLRMSTERQDFSITHQRLAIAIYAAAHGLRVVETFADEGISGLGVERRTGLKSLLAKILSGSATFQTVLVYDVSRWGRFQNPDQAAHYEFLCSESGVAVVYCAEEFANDGTLSSMLLKNIKRIMAAEYSGSCQRRCIAPSARWRSRGSGRAAARVWATPPTDQARWIDGAGLGNRRD